MADVFTKAKRSEVMSRIRSRGNKDTELALVRVFRAHGIKGWRKQVQISGRAALLHGPNIRAAQQCRPVVRPMARKGTSPRPSPQSGEGMRVRPDFVFPKLRLAIFVDGCFWHGCPKHETRPQNNAAFWRKKFARNKARDRLVTRTLRQNGWRVLRIWEHELARKREARLVARLRRAQA